MAELMHVKVFWFVVFHLFAVLFYFSLVMVVWTEPGPVPQEDIEEQWRVWDEYLQQERERLTERQKTRRSQRSRPDATPLEQDSSVVDMGEDDDEDESYRLQQNLQRKNELLDKPGKRFCNKCLIPKPARTHHCSQCKCCWQKMDHHCQWVNNCVALLNYKYFFVMLVYASGLLLTICITYWKTFVNIVITITSDLELFIVVLHYYFTILITVIIVGFTLFHMFLILQNKSTLEYLEKKKDSDRYNGGLIFNLQFVLGSNPLIWLLPIKN